MDHWCVCGGGGAASAAGIYYCANWPAASANERRAAALLQLLQLLPLAFSRTLSATVPFPLVGTSRQKGEKKEGCQNRAPFTRTHSSRTSTYYSVRPHWEDEKRPWTGGILGRARRRTMTPSSARALECSSSASAFIPICPLVRAFPPPPPDLTLFDNATRENLLYSQDLK